MIDLANAVQNKKVVFFGAGGRGREIFEGFPFPVAYFVDNAVDKHGTRINDVPVEPPSRLAQEDKDRLLIVVTTTYYNFVYDQLGQMGLTHNEHFVDSESFLHIVRNRGRGLSPETFANCLCIETEDERQFERCTDLIRKIVTYALDNKDLARLVEVEESPLECCACGGSQGRVINTHRYGCEVCSSCGTVRRRDKWPVLSEKERQYDYFLVPEKLEYDREVWPRRFASELTSGHGFDFAGKTILDVSGGSGLFIKYFERLGAKVWVTEFHKPSVDFARDELGVNAAHFDFDVHRIHETVKDRFDFVFLRESVNSCLNAKDFVEDLTKVLKPGAVVVSEFVTPGLGSFLREQSGDYGTRVFYEPDFMQSIFEDRGFSTVDRVENSRSLHDDYVMGFKENILKRGMLYGFPAALGLLDPDMNRTGCRFVFRWP